MKLKSKKSALLMSFTSLLICFAMLAGSTFAWFTDTATTGVNKIQAGNLDVELLMYSGTDYVNISKDPAPIFGSENSTVAQNNNLDTLWEPGKTQVAYLAIKNEGNLDLKYQVALNVTNPADGKDLYQAMRYAIVSDVKGTDPVLPAWTTGNAVDLGAQIVSGTNTEDATPAGVKLLHGATHYFALLVHMDENAGNGYQNGKVEFDLKVYAVQLNSESDSFNNEYDKNAEYDNGDTPPADATKVATAAELKNAITSAEDGDYILLADDLTLTDFIKVDKSITVDLNGKTITQNGKATFIVMKNDEVKISNGKFVLDGTQPKAVVLGKGSYYGTDYNSADCNVTINNVDFDVIGSQGVAIAAGTNTGKLNINGGTYTVSGTQAKGLDIGNCHAAISNITVNVTGDATGMNFSSVLEDTLVEVKDSSVTVEGASPFYDQDCINISGTNVNLTNCNLTVKAAAKSGRAIEMSANNWFDSTLNVTDCVITNEGTGSAVYNNFGSPSSFSHMTTTHLYGTTVTAKYAFGSYKHNDSAKMFVVHSGQYSSKVPSDYYQVVLAEGSSVTNSNGIYTVTAAE